MRYLLALLLLAGCNRTNLGKYELLGELRVLALSLDLPEVSPGGAVVMTPLLSDLNGAGRTLTYSVEACVDPGLNLGADPTCAGRADRVVLVENQAITGIAAPNYTGAVNTVNITVPPTVLTGRSARDQHNGVAYLVFYELKDATGNRLLMSFKEITVSTKATKNTNPILASLQVNGAAAAALPTAKSPLTAVFTGDPKESFAFLDVNGNSETFQEEIVVSWFITDGELDDNRTGQTDPSQWTPPATAPAGRSVQIFAVARDRRGGESFSMIPF